MCGSREGGQGVQTPPPPLENYKNPPGKITKNIGFLSNTGPDPLRITKLPIQHLMVGHHRPVSETPLKWRLAGGPLMARLKWYLDPSSPHQTKKNTKIVKIGPLLTKLPRSAHASVFICFADSKEPSLIAYTR